MGTWLDFSIIFLIVLALFGMFEWLVRWFGAGRRDQVDRLGVIDSVRIDRRRTLVLLRRDNIERLVMIGGPNDMVIEQNALRPIGAHRAQRAVPGPSFRAVEFSNETASLKVPPRPQPMESQLPSTWRPAPPLAPRPSPQSVYDVGELRETLKALLHDSEEQRLDTKPAPRSEPKLQPKFAPAKSEAEIEPKSVEPKSVEEKWTEPNLESKPEPEQQAESQSESGPAKLEAETEPEVIEPQMIEEKLTETKPESEVERQAESKAQPENEPEMPGP